MEFTLWQQILAEFVGSLLLIYIGDGVVANCILDGSNGKGLGTTGIDVAWGVAVALPAFIFMDVSGAYFNPAVILGFLWRGEILLTKALIFIVADILGMMIGSYLVYLTFLKQFQVTEDVGTKLNCFTTRPAIRDTWKNFLSELIGTTFLIYFVMEIVNTDCSQLAKACLIGTLVFGLAICMGGCTGASLNCARDLGPRLAHTILPVHKKGSSEWDYGWIPVAGQICASFVAAGLYMVVHWH